MSETINKRINKIIDELEDEDHLKKFVLDLIKLEIKNSNDHWKYKNEYERIINSHIRKYGEKMK